MSGRRVPPEDREALERAMAGVKPLADGEKKVARPPPPRPAPARPAEPPREPVVFLPDDPDAPARWARDLGRGAILDLGRDAGGLREIDLHGLTRAEARRSLEEAVAVALRRGEPGLRVVHGKGLRSGGPPVLRSEVRRWLAGPELGGLVAGFREAPPALGGSGATLVRLRRPRRNAAS